MIFYSVHSFSEVHCAHCCQHAISLSKEESKMNESLTISGGPWAGLKWVTSTFAAIRFPVFTGHFGSSAPVVPLKTKMSLK